MELKGWTETLSSWVQSPSVYQGKIYLCLFPRTHYHQCQTAQSEASCEPLHGCRAMLLCFRWNHKTTEMKGLIIRTWMFSGPTLRESIAISTLLTMNDFPAQSIRNMSETHMQSNAVPSFELAYLIESSPPKKVEFGAYCLVGFSSTSSWLNNPEQRKRCSGRLATQLSTQSCWTQQWLHSNNVRQVKLRAWLSATKWHPSRYLCAHHSWQAWHSRSLFQKYRLADRWFFPPETCHQRSVTGQGSEMLDQ